MNIAILLYDGVTALDAIGPIAQEIQLIIEYDPEPPFNAGSPAKAPKHVVESLQEKFAHLAS